MDGLWNLKSGHKNKGQNLAREILREAYGQGVSIWDFTLPKYPPGAFFFSDNLGGKFRGVANVLHAVEQAVTFKVIGKINVFVADFKGNFS